ncbi:MAG TPA: protein kinase [Thermoanaerobaculia bacterium]|jgi:serine/threonine-protein kinase|nr:protein kinase [Thermoanaerobaculia bacterium]
MDFIGGEQLGPYRLVERLGVGGMGEVYLAIDQRLDRRVALKRIRSTGGSSPERRERFRREARLAARLNHSSIVQIYDVLAEGEDEVLVLEYVEGTTLRRLVDSSPLQVGRAAALGRDIAEGLAEAHRQGIVHRDLKSENILVTAAGRAKIADFGVAKRQQEGDELTASGMVMGTTRSMSPEQARGEPVDFRSDLFSLGVLLYEVLGGRSPFAGANQLSTVQRILHSEPEPLALAVPTAPKEFADLVHRLLAKEPHLRPRSAAEVAAALSAWADAPGSGDDQPTWVGGRPASAAIPSTQGAAAPVAGQRSRRRLYAALVGLLVLAGGLGAYFALRPPLAPLEIAVLAPSLGGTTGAGDSALLTAGLRVAELQMISGLAGVAAKSPEEIDSATGGLRQVAQALAADELIATRLACREEECQVTLQRIRGADANLLDSASFSVRTDDPLLAARAVAARVRSFYPERKARSGSGDLSVSSRDFAEFLRLSARFRERRAANLGALLDEVAALSSRAPQFLEARLLEAEIARYRFVLSRDPADLERALASDQEAQRIAPGDPRPLSLAVSVALGGGRLEVAESALDALDRLSPGDPLVLGQRAMVAHARGRPEEALRLSRAAAASHRSIGRLYSLAWLEVQQGETAAARATLEELLGRAPGHTDGLSQLGYLELSNGNTARAAELYAELVRRTPRFAPLTNLGVARLLLGRYAEAEDAFERASKLEPDNQVARLNLADARFLLGKRAEAETSYRTVLDLVAKDPAAATNPQLLTVRGQALAHLERGAEAVAAVQEALRLAPKSPQVAYESSLVYTLVGERLSAIATASRARALGLEPVWFSFPWFEPLRHDPEFQKLLAASEN